MLGLATRSLMIGTLLATSACRSHHPRSEADGGVPLGVDGGDGAPSRGCQPLPTVPGPWQPAQASAPDFRSSITLSPGRARLLAPGATPDGFLRSDDVGATWCYVTSPARPARLFFGGSGDGTIYLWTMGVPSASDGGATDGPA